MILLRATGRCGGPLLSVVWIAVSRGARRYDLVEDDYALVIASDGVWELLSSQTVADIIANTKGDVQDMCDTIVDQSSYMWKVEEGDYRDDITVIVLLMPWISETMRAEVASATASAS